MRWLAGPGLAQPRLVIALEGIIVFSRRGGEGEEGEGGEGGEGEAEEGGPLRPSCLYEQMEVYMRIYVSEIMKHTQLCWILPDKNIRPA